MQTGTFVTIVPARGSFSSRHGVVYNHGCNTAIQPRSDVLSLSLSLGYVLYIVERLNRILAREHVFSPGQRRSACQRNVRVTIRAFLPSRKERHLVLTAISLASVRFY